MATKRAAKTGEKPAAVVRHIKPELIAWFDKKLKNNPIFQEAGRKSDAREIFALAAEALVGTREVGGNNRGPIVKLLQETIGGANGESWCMSGMQSCLAYAEHVTGVCSPVAAGELCTAVYANTPKAQRVKLRPLRGAIVIWQYYKSSGGKLVATIQGHTGMIRSADEKTMQMVECNTESGLDAHGDIERDGGGVYLTKRPAKGTAKMHVLGILKPF